MTSVACIACGGTDTAVDESASRSLGFPDDLRVIRCRRCSLRWLSPARSREDYLEIYRSSYFETLPEDYGSVVADRSAHFRERIGRMRRWFQDRPFSLLDVGAATGEFLHEALRAGIDAIGIEPSESACREAEEKFGIRLIRGDIFDVPPNMDAYDVIHMNHVFEHIPYPKECLRKLHEMLKPGGYLMIEVPYQFGNFLERCRARFGILEPQPFSMYSIHHPFFYTPKCLKILLRNHGFGIRQVRVWRGYLSSKLEEAGRYCRYPAWSLVEQYAHLANIVLKEKGRFVSFEVCARKT